MCMCVWERDIFYYSLLLRALKYLSMFTPHKRSFCLIFPNILAGFWLQVLFKLLFIWFNCKFKTDLPLPIMSNKSLFFLKLDVKSQSKSLYFAEIWHFQNVDMVEIIFILINVLSYVHYWLFSFCQNIIRINFRERCVTRVWHRKLTKILLIN